MAWVPKVGRHVAVLVQKTFNGNTNYVERRPAVITAVGVGDAIDCRVRHTGETYTNLARRVNPSSPSLPRYVSY